jgi:hypothetical protein
MLFASLFNKQPVSSLIYSTAESIGGTFIVAVIYDYPEPAFLCPSADKFV